MLKNYIKIMLRNFLKHRFYSALNIIGLAVGLACCILIGLFLYYELGYDRHHKNRDQIYRIFRETTTVEHTEFSERTPGGLVETLQQGVYPEIAHAVRLHRWSRNIKVGNQTLYDQSYCLTDQNILQVFDFPFIQGDPKTALLQPGAVLITQRLSKKLFGTTNPIGKTILLEESDKDYAHVITGVLKDIPQPTTLQFDILSATKNGRWQEKWAAWKPKGGHPVESYILLKKGYEAHLLENKLSNLVLQYLGETAAKNNNYHLQPLNRIHLYSNSDYGIKAENKGTPETSKPHSDIQNVYVFLFLAIFILTIACVNFVNLTTARAMGRQKEVGLRKVVGANRQQLIKQFLGESLLLSFVALSIALILVYLALPYFNTFFDSAITFQAITVPFILGLLTLISVVGIVSGIYPAFVLSAFQPISALKNTSSTNTSNRFRNSLVIGQFAIATFLIITTWGVYNQQTFLRHKNLGFDRNHIIEIPIFGAANSNQKIGVSHFKQQYHTIKQAFTSHSNILSATSSRGLVGQWSTLETFEAETKDTYSMEMIGVDEDFLDFYNIEQISGRNFSQVHARTDNTQKRDQQLEEQFILNETAVKKLGWTNPIGKRFIWNYGGTFFPNGLRPGKIIGVVKDFHFKPLHQKIAPLVLVTDLKNFEQLYLKIKPENVSETLAFAQTVWKNHIPNRPFQFSFLDENLDQIYQSEQRLSQLFSVFSTLSILIACLGLLGLTTLSIQYRTKEIGIRKVLGASVSNIVILLSSDFAKLILFANLLAWPIAYYALWHWLQDYPYHISLGFGLFTLSGTLTCIIAIITVGFQTFKAASTNPVDTLRSE